MRSAIIARPCATRRARACAHAHAHDHASPTSASPVASSLRDRVILITGATGGLGAPLARACAALGATVVLHGRVVRKLEALYDEIVGGEHPEPVILPLDLAKATADDFGNVASALQAQLGRLDGSCTRPRCWGRSGPSSTSRSTAGCRCCA